MRPDPLAGESVAVNCTAEPHRLGLASDVSAMLETLLPGLRAPEGSLEFRLLPGSPGTEGLVVDPPKAALRNNHLGYAITWFGLAAVLAVMAGIFVWRLRQDLVVGQSENGRD